MREVPEDQQHFSCLLLHGLELPGRVNMRKGLDRSSLSRSSGVTTGGAPGGGTRIAEMSGWHGEGKIGKEIENVFGAGL